MWNSECCLFGVPGFLVTDGLIRISPVFTRVVTLSRIVVEFSFWFWLLKLLWPCCLLPVAWVYAVTDSHTHLFEVWGPIANWQLQWLLT